MRSRVSALTSSLPDSARETVDTDTPASRATSAICGRARVPARAAGGVSGGAGGGERALDMGLPDSFTTLHRIERVDLPAIDLSRR
jgi:hypothetical protein